MKVLIAEDRPTTRYILNKKLNEWGYEVVEAEDGAIAWELLNTDDPPRIAILDWIMPGYDGVAICKMLKERENSPFVYSILLTSKSRKEDLVYALENGAHNFQSKPISPDELRSHINVGRHLVEADDKLKEYANQMEHLAQERARQLVHADRLASIGTLSAGIAHEIGNPLTFIMGQAKMLQIHWTQLEPYIKQCIEASGREDKTFLDMIDSFAGKFEMIQEGSRRLNSIIKSMKSFSRKGTSKRKPVKIEDCVNESLELCRNSLKYHVAVETSFDPSCPPVMINPQQIEQVLVNLISNAADSLKEAGTGELKIKTGCNGSYVSITVEDTGPGFDTEDPRCIFEPFYTTKEENGGTGLGLSISRGIIEDHGGDIKAENRTEGGARFLIRLPLKNGL